MIQEGDHCTALQNFPTFPITRAMHMNSIAIKCNSNSKLARNSKVIRGPFDKQVYKMAPFHSFLK